ncbi:bis(5'-nucleosyl)-tetraphosphatase (symmetrical) YqeK [Veillonella tobetsuensis]|uniref:bis(5'-nucleosyl)-tetraphosphatase (symmetrical) n=1 Tax=Veillonella tobetsuensis TaxID=1110546 RepID=A0A2S7ZNC2_9FIRM|nr:bis(5'-nucleosyl)-tetraphosphatase (symmetrical) YqeK [Veillonella tobetsuensis]MBF1756431.1 bis(5'-nucleosyl)-tetraphosphatase (symmetrical) YqeK [Veillonella tobetsuensis]PQL24732.1 hydrolase [Veillonella tobetsuensis]
MDIKEIETDLSNKLSKKRFIHTLGVVNSAMYLAKKYGANIEDAHLAALLHDCAKEIPLLEMRDLVADLPCDQDMLHSGALLHGLAGMVLANTQYGVTNPDILEAIRVHTTGKENMSKLDKIIFLADYIEPNRKFPGVNDIRLAAEQSLDAGVLCGFDMTIRHLIDSGDSIYPLTILSRNDLLRHMKKGGANNG